MKTIKTTLLTIAVLLCSISASAYQGWIEVNGINYYYISSLYGEISDVTVVSKGSSFGYYGNEYYTGDVVIPESIDLYGDSYPVIGVANGAFKDCVGLTSVTLPNSITHIGYEAFRNCTGLTNITLPNSVTSIGDSAFCHCYSLTNLTLPNSVTDIGRGILAETSWWNDQPDGMIYLGDILLGYKGEEPVGEIEIKNGTKIIGKAFYGCRGITNITIPSSVTNIRNEAFKGCYNLESITIPNSVTSIGDYAFEFCSGLTSVTIGNSVTSIGDYAFESCSGLTSVTIPNSVTSIGNHAFYGCYNLTAVHISDIEAWCKIKFSKGVYDYSSNPLYYAHHLYLNGEEVTDLVIPNSVTNIGACAFAGCTGLTSITIPNSVTNIGASAFNDCDNLTAVHITDLEAWCKMKFDKESFMEYSSTPLYYAHHLYLNGKEIKDLIIPNTVTSIEHSVFYGATGLTSITIPNSVTNIGTYAFEGCNNLATVHITDLEAWCRIEFAGNGSSPLSYAQHLYLNGKEVKDLMIPNSVTNVGNHTFSGCTGLTSITIPNSVTSIGDYAFKYCI